MTTTVIYHSADFDGLFCREIAKRFLPEADLIGWNFGDASVVTAADEIYVLDLPPECVQGIESKIGHWFGKDHSTVHHAVHRVEDACQCYGRVRADLDALFGEVERLGKDNERSK